MHIRVRTEGSQVDVSFRWRACGRDLYFMGRLQPCPSQTAAVSGHPDTAT